MAGFMNIASVADFALDSFPVSGGVTTLHSLWMGLPVLTFKPENAIAIQTYSGNILREVGLDECVTSSPQELVSRASCWMQNPNLIDNLRSKTREKLVSSPFMDYDHRVRELEACFSEMWRRFMENEAVEDLTIADYES
jgi:protein O-GlcNAc transferase